MSAAFYLYKGGFLIKPPLYGPCSNFSGSSPFAKASPVQGEVST